MSDSPSPYPAEPSPEAQPAYPQPYQGQPGNPQPYQGQPGDPQTYQGQPGDPQTYQGGYVASYGYPPVAGPHTNTLAIVSLVAGIAGLSFAPFVAAIGAIVTGHMARRQLQETGETGQGLAIAGLVLGYIGIIFPVLLTALVRPRRLGLWVTFALVHGWLTVLGVVVAPRSSFYDVDLYRFWMNQALDQGSWPVLDHAWVYPAGAILPMLLPGLVSTWSTAAYALAWCVMVAALDAAALVVLLRAPADARARTTGAWWWLAFLLLLGPVAIGRLDAVVAPLMMIALTLAARSARGTAAAAALMTFGAWVKVAPGALLLPLAAAVRRPVRQVVVPAAAVCVVVVAAVAAGGGLTRLSGFLTTQESRGLQVESTGATPWMLASLVRHDVVIRLNRKLITYEVLGPGTATAARLLDLVLFVLVAGLALGLLVARRRGHAPQAFLPAALTLLTTLIVANKVGSPQYLAWLAAPIAVLLTMRSQRGEPLPRWATVAAVVALVAAALSQAVFPWFYIPLLRGNAAVSAALALRNVCLLVILACAGIGLVNVARVPRSGVVAPMAVPAHRVRPEDLPASGEPVEPGA